jgi:hypothetical protein
MSLTERKLWRKIKRGVQAHGPGMTAAVERSFGLVRDSLSVAEMARLIEGTRSEAFAAALLDDARLDRAFDPARARLIGSTQAATNGFIRDLPGGLAATSGFNMLDEKVLEAVGRLDSRVMTSLRSDVRETARLAFRQGLEAGLAPATIARGIRDTIGLAPNQLAAVGNFEKALRDGRIGDALGYKLRDKRFDRTLAGVAEKGLSSVQIDKMVAAYKRRYLNHNAKTHAYTAINDSQRLGKHLATMSGIESGALPADRMASRWASSQDGKERPTHAAANGEVVKFGEPFSTGDVIPGSSEWGCRCIKVDFVLAEGEALPGPTAPKAPKKPPARPAPPPPKPTPPPATPITTPAPKAVPTPPPPTGLPRVSGSSPDFSRVADLAPEIGRLAPEAQQAISDGINTVLGTLGGRLRFLGLSGKTARSVMSRPYPNQANAIYGRQTMAPQRPGFIVFKAKHAKNAVADHAEALRINKIQHERQLRRARDSRDVANPGSTAQASRQAVVDELEQHPPRWTVGEIGPASENLFSTAAHEAGHASYYQRGLAQAWMNATRGIPRTLKLRVSTYAGTDASELFAETTAAIAAGHASSLPPEIVAAWRSVTGR